ncbi:macro domain-containing protein [Aidingimonas halophila]|uniref:O-acetyl-ADP-ribose deacetylase (Regulator of RNase III), contains Macro domain n=1 Tax=Aidingimonas halophila TaxID=574349 RepID=A0A1H2SIC7_9GAMM|nr:macro domain-containing protein [Aidingimonas halophila]GHC17599.1 Appr-1-p processing protein [Aidingimonas halophila]SDW31302.1 O-acetyl-ADP-ribose deacetylase (regulator of RNase III), contains Macro domain [Aidingimonas halophila]
MTTPFSIECIQGDIARQDGFDAVVNAANAELQIGGGVAGAIHRTAGPGLAEECRPLAPIHPGQAVITSAHQLPNRYVIHCLGPIYGIDEPADTLLADCYRHAIEVAERHEITTLAFPSLSTGAFGYPMAEAARIALSTVMKARDNARHLQHVRFVLFDKRSAELHQKTLTTLENHGTQGTNR